MCSTGCFAKYGSERLDNLLECSVEKNDCVHVPGKENQGWSSDSLADLPSKPLENFDVSSLQGAWYKVMGLDSRYDCFDCQRNSFEVTDEDTLDMEALFRIPRPSYPGYLQSKINEELHATDKTTNPLASLQSQGKMFGLTFWENWYIIGESKGQPVMPVPQFGIASALAAVVGGGGAQTEEPPPDLKLVFYTGHTLQGSYKGAFLYSRSPFMTPTVTDAAMQLIRSSGLNPNDFCVIRNTCFLKVEKKPSMASIGNRQTSKAVITSSSSSTATTLQGSSASALPMSDMKSEVAEEQDTTLVASASSGKGKTELDLAEGGKAKTQTRKMASKMDASSQSAAEKERKKKDARKNAALAKAAAAAAATAAVNTDEYKFIEAPTKEEAPFWYIGQRFFQASEAVGKELADWFEDPEILSDWLVSQQQRMVLQQPLAVSPFASFSTVTGDKTGEERVYVVSPGNAAEGDENVEKKSAVSQPQSPSATASAANK